MNKLLKFLAAFAVACMLVGFASPAAAQCNPTDVSSKDACYTSCNSCAGPFQGACKAQCAKIGNQPQPKTKFCAKEGKAIPVDEWSSERCDKSAPPPATKFCAKEGKNIPVAEWSSERCDKSAPPPPPPGKCGPNEESKDGACVCIAGFEKQICGGPCVAVCAEGQIRNAKGDCVDAGNGGPCKDPCPGFAKKVQETDHLGWLILIALGVFGHLGFHIWVLFGRKPKDEEPKAPKPKAKPPAEPEKPKAKPPVKAAAPPPLPQPEAPEPVSSEPPAEPEGEAEPEAEELPPAPKGKRALVKGQRTVMGLGPGTPPPKE